MTKTQQIKAYVKMMGLSLSKCKTSGVVTIGFNIRYVKGDGWKGWTNSFNNYNELFDYFMECKANNTRPWTV